jgi:hypothetical protein
MVLVLAPPPQSVFFPGVLLPPFFTGFGFSVMI